MSSKMLVWLSQSLQLHQETTRLILTAQALWGGEETVILG